MFHTNNNFEMTVINNRGFLIIILMKIIFCEIYFLIKKHLEFKMQRSAIIFVTKI